MSDCLITEVAKQPIAVAVWSLSIFIGRLSTMNSSSFDSIFGIHQLWEEAWSNSSRCVTIININIWQLTSNTSNFILYFGYMFRPLWGHHEPYHLNHAIQTLRTSMGSHFNDVIKMEGLMMTSWRPKHVAKIYSKIGCVWRKLSLGGGEVFSQMKTTQSRYGSRLTDGHLKYCLYSCIIMDPLSVIYCNICSVMHQFRNRKVNENNF